MTESCKVSTKQPVSCRLISSFGVILYSMRNFSVIVILLVGEVAKYCNEHICICFCLFVCLSVCKHISRTTRHILLRWGDEILRGRAILEVFFPIDNALHSVAFGAHTKTAEPIQMPFGLMTRVGHRYHVLDGGPDPSRRSDNFGGKHNSLYQQQFLLTVQSPEICNRNFETNEKLLKCN